MEEAVEEAAEEVEDEDDEEEKEANEIVKQGYHTCPSMRRRRPDLKGLHIELPKGLNKTDVFVHQVLASTSTKHHK
jgi:hypothetical protein